MPSSKKSHPLGIIWSLKLILARRNYPKTKDSNYLSVKKPRIIQKLHRYFRTFRLPDLFMHSPWESRSIYKYHPLMEPRFLNFTRQATPLSHKNTIRQEIYFPTSPIGRMQNSQHPRSLPSSSPFWSFWAPCMKITILPCWTWVPQKFWFLQCPLMKRYRLNSTCMMVQSAVPLWLPVKPRTISIWKASASLTRIWCLLRST